MPETHTQHYRTPCSPAWDADWIAQVNAAEATEQHAVCGAHTPQGTPCTLPPNHVNGRCRYHGGFDGSGAQPGNRNARIHGLYARGLQPCGRHCPRFDHCPVPTPELDQVPLNNRPTCPYEATQYQAALTDSQDRIQRLPGHDPQTQHLAPQAALLQVMLSRAAAALAVQPLIHQSPAPENPKIPPYPPITSPALSAFLRLSAEYRRYLALLDNPAPEARPVDAAVEHTHRQQHDTDLRPEARSKLEDAPDPPPPEHQEQQRLHDHYEVERARCQAEIDALPPQSEECTPSGDGYRATSGFFELDDLFADEADPAFRREMQQRHDQHHARAESHRRNVEALRAAHAPP